MNVIVTLVRGILHLLATTVLILGIQRRALRIIFPEAGSYNEALQLTKLDTLLNRRVSICKGYMNKMKTKNAGRCFI
jgi:hypothetical protein